MYKCNITIEPWMATKTGLSGNKLILFALLWYESKQGKEEVSPDYTQISAVMGTTHPTMYNCLKDMVRAGILLATGKNSYLITIDKNS